jgi:uncharacterized lipoprotein YmbA
MGNAWLSRRHLLAGLAVPALIGGCGTSPPARQFLLAPRSADKPVRGVGRIMIAGVGIAKYLDRPQIVRHGSEYELALADLERWGEGMQDMLARVLAENLAARLLGSQIFVGDGAATVAADANVELYVERFDPNPDGTLVLKARWTIRRGSGPARLGSDLITRQPASGATGDLVASMSDAFALLADRLAPSLAA